MLNAGSSGVDVGTEAGSIAESLARIVQQCPEDVRARALSLMNAENGAQLVVHINGRLQAFLDSKKSNKNDDRSIFEKRKSALDLGAAAAQFDANSNFRCWQSLPPALGHASGFSSDEEDVFSSGEKEKYDDDSSTSDDRERSFSTTDSESKPLDQLIRAAEPNDHDSSMSDGDVSEQMLEAAEPDPQETQSFDPDKIDVDNEEEFSADEMKGNSSDTDMSVELKCLRFLDMSGCFDDDDDDEKRSECGTRMSEANVVRDF